MKKRTKLIFFTVLTLIACSLFFEQKNSLQNLKSNLILENAVALASECKSEEVKGSKYTVTCNTPIDDKGGKCSKSVVTCQGSAGCCKRDYCQSHMNE